jgi:hypothetical protein
MKIYGPDSKFHDFQSLGNIFGGRPFRPEKYRNSSILYLTGDCDASRVSRGGAATAHWWPPLVPLCESCDALRGASDGRQRQLVGRRSRVRGGQGTVRGMVTLTVSLTSTVGDVRPVARVWRRGRRRPWIGVGRTTRFLCEQRELALARYPTDRSDDRWNRNSRSARPWLNARWRRAFFAVDL